MSKFREIIDSIIWHYYNQLLYPLYRKTIKYRVRCIRKKKTIKVLFIITEIGYFKTKKLYDSMLRHHRFCPLLGVTTSLENPSAKYELTNFLKDNDYHYVDLDDNPSRKFKTIKPDIIFYQKPYQSCYRPYFSFVNHLSSLFCHVNYAFNSQDIDWFVRQPLFSCVWQQYFENSLTANPQRLLMIVDKGKQAVITGLPIQDQLITSKESLSDPWKQQTKNKKRIIYAPHHTIGSRHFKGLAISSFLENCDMMLELMHKYSNQTQWVFKPHPFLYKKLVDLWGEEKTDRYYDEWSKSENSQLENGVYDALFLYSDAMIHDCFSFTIEYLYAHNPVFFLMRQKGEESDRNAFAQKAYDLHYKGYTKQQIEEFVLNVINGIDPLKKKREIFYNEYLLPPHKKTACENIINAILGEKEYK